MPIAYNHILCNAFTQIPIVRYLAYPVLDCLIYSIEICITLNPHKADINWFTLLCIGLELKIKNTMDIYIEICFAHSNS